jgi:O-antigen ligase
MPGKLSLSTCITANKMNNINLLLIWLFVLFINEYESIHKISLLLMIIIGVIYYYKNRSKRIDREEKNLILLFLLYFLSFIPSFIVDNNFQWRHLDHPSRFLLYLPLIFLFKQIRRFVFLKYIFLTSSITGSLIVIVNYFYLDVWRGFYFNSCISGAQHLQVLGLFSLVFALDHKCKRIKYAGWIAYLLSNVAVVCSETRGVILCIPILFLVTLYFSPRKINYFKFGVAFAVTSLTLSFALFHHPRLLKRFGRTVENMEFAFDAKQQDFDHSSSIGIRLLFFKYGIKAFLDYPVLGSGRAGFKHAMVDAGYPDAHKERATHSHNQYLSTLAMRGLLGFSILLFFILSLLRIFLNYHKSGHSAYSLCGIIFIVAYLLYFLTDSPLIGSMHASRFFIFMVLLLFYSCKADHDLKRGHEY